MHRKLSSYVCIKRRSRRSQKLREYILIIKLTTGGITRMVNLRPLKLSTRITRDGTDERRLCVTVKTRADHECKTHSRDTAIPLLFSSGRAETECIYPLLVRSLMGWVIARMYHMCIRKVRDFHTFWCKGTGQVPSFARSNTSLQMKHMLD